MCWQQTTKCPDGSVNTGCLFLPSDSIGAADSLTEEQQEMVDSAAELLYGLIHARYIITSRGLQYMVRRVASRGNCVPKASFAR